MPGQVYNRNLRDRRAYAEGLANAGGVGVNPHPVGSSAAAAWDAGDIDGAPADCSDCADCAECTDVVPVG